MNNELMEATKLAAYFQWEYTGYNNALSHWYCAEDIACFLETYGVLSIDQIKGILSRGFSDLGYIEFVRHIAFRIYIYSNNPNAKANWFAAEKLIHNYEWCNAIITVAVVYRENKGNNDFTGSLKSDIVKKHYHVPSSTRNK